MQNEKHKFSLYFAGLLVLLLAQTTAADVVVITNKSTGVDNLTKDQVKALFLQKEKSFADGAPAILADQNEDSVVRKEFSRKVLGKSPKKLKRYWSKRVFSGKGVPPKVIGDNSAMKEWVAETPNSLGYISADAVDDSVKVLFKP